MQTIAILITCFNRREKTLQCLQDIYSQKDIDQYNINIYIVDGGSSDGTQTAIHDRYPEVNIETIEGLYWAGGMRAAWNTATTFNHYDYFLLINDDTHLYLNCLEELFKADEYSIKKFNKQGIYIGSVHDPNSLKLSYGGIDKRENGKWIIPDGKNYTTCELGNANIMMVSKHVFDSIGGFAKDYTHGIADYDYTLRACNANLPVLILPCYVGTCENDHKKTWSSQSVSLKKRIGYLYSPKGLAYKEYMLYLQRFYPQKIWKMKCKLWLKTLFPIIWEKFKKNDIC